MFEIMYLIFLAFVIAIAVAVSIYEIRARRNAENAFWRECEESTAAKETSNRLEGENLSLKEQYNLLHNKNSQLVIYNTELCRQINDAHEHERLFSKKLGKCMAANEALQKRNFDDMMSLFDCTIGEGGKEYYEKDGICLIVEDGKCIGYYRPHGEDACESEERADEAEECPASTADAVLLHPRDGYETPSAEVVEGGEKP